MLRLLLRYHDPTLASYLEENGVTPEMYATPWFLTYFSNKLEKEVLYHLWDKIMSNDDPAFILFFSVGFLVYHRVILNSSEPSMLP